MALEENRYLEPFSFKGEDGRLIGLPDPKVRAIDPIFLYDPTLRQGDHRPEVPPTFSESVSDLAAGFYGGSLIGAPLVEAIQRDFDSERWPAQPGYTPLEDPQLEGMESFYMEFYGSKSPEETRARLYRLNERLDIQSKGGTWNQIGLIMGSTIDPVWGLAGPARALRLLSGATKTIPRSVAFHSGIGFTSEALRLGMSPSSGDFNDVLLGTAFGAIAGGTFGTIRRINENQLARAAERYRAEVDFTQARIENLRGATFHPVDEIYEAPPLQEVSPNQTYYSGNNATIQIDDVGTGGTLTSADKSGTLGFSIEDGVLRVKFVGVSSKNQGQGVGVSMYEDLLLYAEEHGLAFKSDHAVTTDAVRIYESLARRGYIVVRNPNATEGPGGLSTDVGESVYTVKRAPDPVNEQAPPKADLLDQDGQPIRPLSAGATQIGALSPSYAQRLDDEAAASAYLLERIPNNPVKRVLMSGSARARDLVSEMMELPFFQNKHFRGQAAVRSIERALHSNRAVIADVMINMRTHYDQYVMRTLGRDLTVLERMTGNNQEVFSYAEFRKQVTLARMSGNRHAVPEVTEAARYVGEKIYDPLAQRAADSGIYPDEIMQEVRGLRADLRRGPDQNGLFTMRGARGDETQVPIQVLQERLDSLENRLAAFQRDPNAGTRPNFVNLVFRRDRIKANRDELKQILMQTFGMDAETANDLIDKMSSSHPYREVGPDSTGMASSLRSRELFGNDLDLSAFIQAGGDKFIETDILALSRYYLRTFGTDLDIFEKFGSINMVDQIAEVVAEYQRLIDEQIAREGGAPQRLLPGTGEGPDTGTLLEGPDSPAVARLKAQRDRDLKDIRAMRDLLRGTYGLPNDPGSGLSTAIRTFKRANAITMLTGAISAVPDVGRIVMTEGFTKTFGLLYEDLSNGLTSFKLARADAQIAGEALDMLLSTRAAMMADIGDGIGLASTFDGIGDKMADFTFNYVNLLNPWTDLMKSWTSLVAGNRILLDSIALSSGSLDDLARAKLHRGGINAEMAERIAEQFQRHGQTEGSVNVARLDRWDDALAKQTYEDALARDISRAIVTPGLGDPPLWMNTEWGGLIGQFKKFSTGAFERIAVAGLQERSTATLHGMVVMVGLGIMIDYWRDGDMGYEGDTSLQDRIMAGVDRSGVLGWMGDIVNAAETMLDPQASGRQIAGVVAGPTGSQVGNLVETFYSMTDVGDTGPTAQNVRRMLPWQNVFWLDGIFDALTGTK